MNDDPPWRADAIALARQHASFGKDGGISRESTWDNLADTLVEMGKLEWYTVVEHAFDKAWPPSKRNPLYRVGRHLLFTNELPEGRSNKVRYFGENQHIPWKPKRGFGPEWNAILRRSGLQARDIIAARNPGRKTRVLRVKCGRHTIEIRLSKRSR